MANHVMAEIRLSRIQRVISESNKAIRKIQMERARELESILAEFQFREREQNGGFVDSRKVVRVTFEFEKERHSEFHIWILLCLLKGNPETYQKKYLRTTVREEKWELVVFYFNRFFPMEKECDKYTYSELLVRMQYCRRNAERLSNQKNEEHSQSAASGGKGVHPVQGVLCRFLLDEECCSKSHPDELMLICYELITREDVTKPADRLKRNGDERIDGSITTGPSVADSHIQQQHDFVDFMKFDDEE